MIFDMKQVVIEIEYRGIVPVEDAMGARIDCLRGRIWITERGCTDDIVLEAGQSCEISRGGVAVVQALREALVALRAPAVPQAGARGRGMGRAALEPVGCARGWRALRSWVRLMWDDFPTSKTEAFTNRVVSRLQARLCADYRA